jgi:nucleotide-binding universal stress UspA family protein
MGTHGRRGFTHLMLGSVAEKVVRAAIRPVLTVPPAAPTDAGLPFRRVMCAVDFSPTSWAAAEVAVALTERSNGRLTFVHIFEWPAELDTLIEISPEIGQARRQREREAEHRLEQLARTSIGVDRRPLWILDHGKPYERIVAMAAEDGADLLIMGVHSRNIFERALLGSTTTQVVRRAHCPVLTLRDVSTTHASSWNVAAVAAPVVG